MADFLTKRSTDYSQWYTDVVLKAELADYSPVKGCMVIRPYGYAIWENMQAILNKKFKETGHQNAYFPLFIPKSFLEKEAEHVEGFAPETAVVTHGGGKELDEPLIVRPTSETIMYAMYSKWIRSYRDLPVLINQWANIVRWEMRTRLFLRTTEFLWQEGHTVHATYDEAQEETLKILSIYKNFAEQYLAIPVIQGKKSDAERFAGAFYTYAIEAMMGDKKALQAGTSHNLGQKFAKAFDVKFQDQNGQWQFAWQTSWGVSTRLIGALIMVHGDDNGLFFPPLIAPIQIVIVPIWQTDQQKNDTLTLANTLKNEILKEFIVHIDNREQITPGFKFNEWEMKGVPIRLELGPKDLAQNQVTIATRFKDKKSPCPLDNLKTTIETLVVNIQKALFERAKNFMKENTFTVDNYKDFLAANEKHGGFFLVHWCGKTQCEETIKTESKATIRCIPLDTVPEKGKCIVCSEASNERVLVAKAY
ncbi:MAG: proline--tRNA ligase [Candidatus Fischerbacteria bacterium RBG_13_37_8]|uniref:Proline--tRNA ligase n=1 Tax=Candidatus Fischerbacteria bacterium RBG_13_37_8 TaxID=1817863 RepID=A0A1F5VNX0_9BACT|nr:MAG: proline--tRNA ligase [Candidatus Fischerbacteria bacterium RBG_13_37_8]